MMVPPRPATSSPRVSLLYPRNRFYVDKKTENLTRAAAGNGKAFGDMRFDLSAVRHNKSASAS